ncbi:MAG TPA: biosynthetic peptidoglycan transglycosylase [Streptosporangiaceae bacterium]|nr:biosynthetic peptidoglycan transglycosylase [Streptosporangiaceae bacterium]
MRTRGYIGAGPQTVPLRGGGYLISGPYPVDQDGWPYDPTQLQLPPPHRPRRRRLRRTRRAAGILIALAILGIVCAVGLFLIEPSVGNAPALAQALDHAHHAAYPGPPVPQDFAAALIATEDHRFYSEPGIDPFAVGRVAMGRFDGGGDQGGATLYQQLAKMLYTSGRTGVMAETEEVALGIKLDFTYPKSTILRLYADVTYFGNGYYGLQAASCGYFQETPAHLSWAQAALLAGIVQAPSTDDPLLHYANARAREVHVLGRLVATGALTQGQAAIISQQSLRLTRDPGTGCSAHPVHHPRPQPPRQRHHHRVRRGGTKSVRLLAGR